VAARQGAVRARLGGSVHGRDRRPDRAGIFVRFGEVFEGFLPARKLPGDYFELDPTATRMQGRRGGGAYRLGDPVDVRVDRIEKPTGKVELAPG